MPGNTRFKARANLPELPKGAERAIIESFRQVEAALAQVQVVQRNATAVMNTPAYMAKAGELVLLEGNATGTLVTIPPGSPANVEQTIRVALVGGVLSPGVTISIIGRKGTIDGAATFVMTQRMLVELTSVGERGWAMTCCGGGGLPPDANYGDITVSGAGTVWTVNPGAVAVGDLANIADQRMLGNVSGAPAPPAELTQAQVRTFIGTFGAANTGLVPASGGGTTNFLRADGAFAAPPGGGGGYATVRNNGVAVTARTILNAVAGTGTFPSITLAAADDAGNTETDLSATIGTAAANTIIANATAGAAVPLGLAVGAESLVGRSSGNITTFASAVQTAFIRAAGSLFFAAAAANQLLGRTAAGDLGFNNLTSYQLAQARITQTAALTATAATTTLSPGTLNLNANELEAGTQYIAEAQIVAGRGATVTATNVIVDFVVTGIAALTRTLTIAISVTASSLGIARVRGIFTVRTAGAGGTAEITLHAVETITGATATPASVSARMLDNPTISATAVAATAVNTTLAGTLAITARLSAATATCFVHVYGATIRKEK